MCLPQPTVSRHLAYLRLAGLVETRKDGLWVHYRRVDSTDPVVASIIGAVTHGTEHVALAGRDSRRLDRIADCCADVSEAPARLACCGPAATTRALARRRTEGHHGRTATRRETPS